MESQIGKWAVANTVVVALSILAKPSDRVEDGTAVQTDQLVDLFVPVSAGWERARDKLANLERSSFVCFVLTAGHLYSHTRSSEGIRAHG